MSSTTYYYFKSCFSATVGADSLTYALYQTSGLTYSVPVGYSVVDSGGNCWEYMGTVSEITPTPYVKDIIWEGNYMGNQAGFFKYENGCLSCPVNQTSVTLQFQVSSSFDGFVPSGATQIFESPNFGASFYDFTPDTGIQYYPPQAVLNDEVIVSQQINLPGAPTFNINRLAVGILHQPIENSILVNVSVYINDILAVSKDVLFERRIDEFGAQIDNLFSDENCTSVPCLNELNFGDTIKIILSQTNL